MIWNTRSLNFRCISTFMKCTNYDFEIRAEPDERVARFREAETREVSVPVVEMVKVASC